MRLVKTRAFHLEYLKTDDEAFDEVNKMLFVSGEHGNKVAGFITIVSLNNYRPLKTILAHSDLIVKLKYIPSARLLISCSLDGLVKVWKPYSNFKLFKNFRHMGATLSFAYLPKSNLLMAGGEYEGIKFWGGIADGPQAGSGPQRKLPPQIEHKVTCLEYLPNSDTITARTNRTLRINKGNSGAWNWHIQTDKDIINHSVDQKKRLVYLGTKCRTVEVHLLGKKNESQRLAVYTMEFPLSRWCYLPSDGSIFLFSDRSVIRNAQYVEGSAEIITSKIEMRLDCHSLVELETEKLFIGASGSQNIIFLSKPAVCASH